MKAHKSAIGTLLARWPAISFWILVAPLATVASQPQLSDVPGIVRQSAAALLASATNRVDPAYPPLARAARVEGSVVVEVTIDEAGNVISARAVSGHPLLKRAAIDALLQWKFAPAMLSGARVKVIGTLTVDFVLDSKSEVAADREAIAASIEQMKREARDHPASAETLYKLAMACRRLGRRTEEVQALKDALAMDPEFLAASLKLSETLDELGADHEDEAIDVLREALRVDPQYRRAELALGALYAKLGRLDAAVASYQGATGDATLGSEPYYGLATTYSRMGKYGEAVEVIKQALQIEPEQERGYLALADLYRKLDQPTGEIGALNWAVALSPSDVDAHYALGMALLKIGDRASAADECDIIKALNPGIARELKQEIDKLPDR